MSKEECPKYLYTPIRENHLRKLKDESASSFPLTASTLANRDMRSSLTGQGPINKYQQQYILFNAVSYKKWSKRKKKSQVIRIKTANTVHASALGAYD